MNKQQKEVEKAKLTAEAKELNHLKAIYKKAAEDVTNKIAIHDETINVLLKDYDNLDDVQKSILQSKVYQKKFQEALKKQLDGFLADLNSNQYKSIDEYLNACYETGFLGSMYDIHGQGIPIITPIDQKQVVKAKDIDSKISKKLYTKLGEDVDTLKKRIANNISRGIATSDSFANMARNIASASNMGFNKAMRIARTEGHRIQAAAAFDAQHKAKDAGADIVKQWDSALDGRTRDSHRMLDGQIRELDEYFEVNGHKARFPSDFGRPEEDINCRCALLQRARWALDEEELQTLKDRAAYYGLDKTEDFEGFRKKYLHAVEETTKIDADTPIAPAKPNVEKTKDGDVAKASNKGTGLLAEQYEARRLAHGLEQVAFGDLDGSAVGADYTGLSKATAEMCNNVLEKYLKQYESYLTRITVGKSVNGAAVTKFHNTIATADVVLKESTFKNLAEMAEDARKGGQMGLLAKVKEEFIEEYYLTHEFAHTMFSVETSLDNFVGLDVKKAKKAQNEVKKLFKEYKAEIVSLEQQLYNTKKEMEKLYMDDGIDFMEIMNKSKELGEEEKRITARLEKVKISQYAGSQVDEFWAEGFTEAKIGENPSPYALKLEKIADDVFGRKPAK